jgi:putative RecB family exonuclease
VTEEVLIRPHRSVSQYTSFTKCGEMYRLEKVAKSPQLPAAWLYQGTAFHHASEYYEQGWVTADEAVKLFYTYYDEEVRKALELEPNIRKWLTGGSTRGEVDIANRRERGAQQLVDYIQFLQANRVKNLEIYPGEFAIELPFELKLGTVRVVGFIDRVLEDGRPRDLKTGSKQPDTAFQLGVYGLAVEQELGIRPAFGDFYMAKNGGKLLPPEPLHMWTRERLTAYFQRIDTSIADGNFVPNPSDFCRICSVSPYCSIKGSSTEFQEDFNA